MVLETLPLEESKGSIPVVDLGLEGLPQPKPKPWKLDSQVCVCCGDLNLVPLEEEMEVRTSFDSLKIITLVLARLILNYHRSQKLDRASTCFCKPFGV
jgi:hypothetical protein